MSTDPFEMFGFKRDPKQDARILNSVEPSNFFPKKGDFFRVRAATIPDRSYMEDIWECLAAQSHAVVGRRVLDSYGGLSGSRIGDARMFVSGDVIFYDCSELWAAIQPPQASQPTES